MKLYVDLINLIDLKSGEDYVDELLVLDLKIMGVTTCVSYLLLL